MGARWRLRINIFAGLPLISLVGLACLGGGCHTVPERRDPEAALAAPSHASAPLHRYKVYRGAPKKLKPAGHLNAPGLEEASGLIQSRAASGLFWSHNDGGHAPLLFPHSVAGQAKAPPTEVLGAENVDWEDIAFDSNGQLIVADVGNNRNERRDLKLYWLPEPAAGAPSVHISRAVEVYYPEQLAFPPALNNFDCEAIYTWDNTVYLLTKHRADRNTHLYRLPQENLTPGPRRLWRISTGVNVGEVTAADISPDGLSLAVLCYDAVWLFERQSTHHEDFLGSTAYRLPIRGRQLEAIAFVGNETLLMSNEQRDLYQLSLAEIRSKAP
jgi:hypothetical protein